MILSINAFNAYFNRLAVPGKTTKWLYNEQNRIWAIRKLKDKANQLGHLPIKADFEAQEIIDIKAALGPWPRALEAAGLKEPREKKQTQRNS